MDKNIRQLIEESEAIIFDFDGTVADTETYSWIAHNKALEQYNIYLTEEDIKRYIGKTDKEIFPQLEKDYNIKLDFEAHFKKRINFYMESIIENNLKPYNFIIEILSSYKDKDYYILSSNNGEVIDKLLKKWNIRNYFKKIYSMLDMHLLKEECIKNSKKYFNTSSSKLILFEDSAKVINMAKKYTVKTVFIENERNKNDQCLYDYKFKA